MLECLICFFFKLGGEGEVILQVFHSTLCQLDFTILFAWSPTVVVETITNYYGLKII